MSCARRSSSSSDNLIIMPTTNNRNVGENIINYGHCKPTNDTRNGFNFRAYTRWLPGGPTTPDCAPRCSVASSCGVTASVPTASGPSVWCADSVSGPDGLYGGDDMDGALAL